MAKSKPTNPDLKQVIVEDGSRGKKIPRKAINLEIERRYKEAIAIAARMETKAEFLEAIRCGFGLQENDPDLVLYAKFWDERTDL